MTQMMDDQTWRAVEVPDEINLANANARMILESIGLNPDFEEDSVRDNTIGDLIERCYSAVEYQGACPDSNSYRIDVQKRILEAAIIGRHLGATHWYFI
jgi:hypothetical protein